jgi:hypothetical protein
MNTAVASRRTNPRNHGVVSGFKAKVLCAHGRALALAHCSVASSHCSGSGYTACSVCSEHCFTFLCFSQCYSLCLKSTAQLCHYHVWWNLINPLREPTQMPFLPKFSDSMINLHHGASQKWSPFTLNSLAVCLFRFLLCIAAMTYFFVLEYNLFKGRNNIPSYVCYPSITPRIWYTVNIYWAHYLTNQAKLKSHMSPVAAQTSEALTPKDVVDPAFPSEKAPNSSQHSAFLRTTWHNPFWVRLIHVASCTN